jgi:hypothetical protein
MMRNLIRMSFLRRPKNSKPDAVVIAAVNTVIQTSSTSGSRGEHGNQWTIGSSPWSKFMQQTRRRRTWQLRHLAAPEADAVVLVKAGNDTSIQRMGPSAALEDPNH